MFTFLFLFIYYCFIDIDNFPKEHIWNASSYLVTRTFDSLREMFTSTKEIQVNKYFLISIILESNINERNNFCRIGSQNVLSLFLKHVNKMLNGLHH